MAKMVLKDILRFLLCAVFILLLYREFSGSRNDVYDAPYRSYGRFLNTLTDVQRMEIEKKEQSNVEKLDEEINSRQVIYLKGSGDPDTVFHLPDDATLRSMSRRELLWMYQTYIKSPQVTCSAVVRFGRFGGGGGGYELCEDPRFKIDGSSCLVYSYGINNDFSFDDAMEARGCEVHSFDPSMDKEPHLRGTRIHFHNTGIGGKDVTIPKPKSDADMGSKKAGNWQVYTIASHRRINGHSVGQRRLDVLKIDVEGYEWESLKTALEAGTLDDVRHMMLETHKYDAKRCTPTKSEYVDHLRLLRLLFDRGFRIFLSPHGRCLHEPSLVNINHINSNWKELVQQQKDNFYKYSHSEKALMLDQDQDKDISKYG